MVERRDRPLFAWGDTLRAARRRRQRAGRAAIVALGCAWVAIPIFVPPCPRLVWNVSRSAPPGLYRVLPGSAVRRGDMVIARMPADVRKLAARRHYLPLNLPLVKRVAALPGDRVCAIGTVITIDDRRAGTRYAADRLDRPLPWWNGCTTLGNGMLFLLMADSPASFDGRYFGPTPTHDVLGRAVPLWLR